MPRPAAASLSPAALRAARKQLPAWYAALFARFGPQHWWPGDTPFEIAVGAVLTQNTAWTNVTRALAQLLGSGCTDWPQLHALPEAALAALIQPAGTYRVKARRLKSLATAVVGAQGGSLDRLLAGPLAQARLRLLAIHGIGPETADALLLYIGGLPTFVVDAYTKRVLRRHGLIDGRATYADVQALFHAAMPADATLFGEYHALLVALGKHHCRAKALCTDCPLREWPHDGEA